MRILRSRRFYLACLALLCIAVAGRWLWRRWRQDDSPHETYAATAAASDALEDPKHLRDWAKAAVANIEKNLRDYTAVFTKRERSGGALGPVQIMFLKVRQKPFSVYMHFLAPEDRKGDEAIYVEGRNGGNLLGHTTGLLNAVLGTIPLSPDSMIAMKGQRHPITEVGLLHLTRLLLEAAQRESRRNVCRIRTLPGAKINGRPCTCIEAIIPFATAAHPQGSRMARIFIDQKLNLPIRYEQYEWSGAAAEKPVLVEQYTYLDLKLNVGLTDADFDRHNPNYSFP
jgi:hypothetical protein